MIIRKVAVLCGMSAVGMLAGCGPSNPLIGDWTQASGGAGCYKSMKFSSDTLVADGNSMHVNYNASAKLVYVMTDGNTVNYDIGDSNHMSYSTPWGKCSYTK